MAKFNHNISTFQAGEVSPKIYGRSDVAQYNQGCKSLLNMLVLPQGGAQSRPGSQYKSTLDAGILYIRNILFIAANGTRFNILMKAGNVTQWRAIDLQDPTTSTGLFTFSDAETVWTEKQIIEAHYVQSGDVLILTQGDKAPLTISYDGVSFRTGVWWQGFPGLDGNEIVKRFPFGDVEILNVNNRGTLTSSAATGVVTLTSSTGIFTPGHIGAVFKLTSAGVTGAVMVFGYTSVVSVSCTVLNGLSVPTVAVGTSAGTSWEEGAWSTYRGFPKACCFFESRIYYAGSASYPTRVWMSRQGNVAHLLYRPLEQDTAFATYTDDNSRPWSFDVAATEYSKIVSLSPGKTLAIFTTGREYIAKGISNTLGQKSFDVKAATSFGAAPIQPIRLNNQAMFVQRSYKRIRNLTFAFEEDDYKSQDVTSLAEHIIGSHKRSQVAYDGTVIDPSFKQIALQTSPDARLWAIDFHGGLTSCTIDSGTNVLAWSPHRLGGKLVTAVGGGVFADNPPAVMSMTIVPSFDNSVDEVWLVVRRTLNGVNSTTLEKMGGYFVGDKLADKNYTDIDDRPIFVDCAGFGSNYVTPSATWTFAHLANETVHVIADGIYIGEKLASGAGVITLAHPASEIIAGFYHERVVQPLGIEVGSPTGSSQGLTKMADTVTVRFVRTVNALLGKGESTDFYPIKFIDPGAFVGVQPELFTGDKREWLGGYSRECSPVIKQDIPYPFEIACIILNGQSYD